MKHYLFLLMVVSTSTYAQKKESLISFISLGRENPSEWILVYADDGAMGYLNAEGEEIVAPVYQMIDPFGEYKDNWARIENKNGLSGFIDNSGKVVVEPKYDYIEKFGAYKENWALVSLGGRYGFIDLLGAEVVKPIYSEIPNLKNRENQCPKTN